MDWLPILHLVNLALAVGIWILLLRQFRRYRRDRADFQVYMQEAEERHRRLVERIERQDPTRERTAGD